MYSYDVPAPAGRSATAARSIPGMRPSYDAEHPHSTTPIYDELYSEFRRLFRALPGDRSGEEDLKFTGFAVRDGYPLLGEQRAYPPQQQAFHTYAGQPPGLPQFMPPQPQHARPAGHTSHASHATAHAPAHASHATAPAHAHASHATAPAHAHAHAAGHTAAHAVGHPEPTAPANEGPGQPAPDPTPAQGAPPSPQFTNGHGWVAAGYLGPVPHAAPAPPAPPAPAPIPGPATAPSSGGGGRHRQMLSLPPGRNGEHH
ncbi:hypothetical protein [Kitasatospora sp. SUK 42]|uniref:hypothetical protein n=1 Tax=Kitasatospora sp. SUK 42 TaxID=1588882 RepID=UPI001C31812F|nr:hypothetical protein [Kitasatospora sp. SUK 42]MBV2151284.1 hypothetical protein [Kitasatospora sp. SUK 42]